MLTLASSHFLSLFHILYIFKSFTSIHQHFKLHQSKSISFIMVETSAASRVFSIPELLHEVLSYLPQTCLLSTIPLVCRSWGVALTSPSLERAQWFRPAIQNGPSTWSDLLEKQFGIFFDFNLISNRNVLDSTAFDTLPWKRNFDAFVSLQFMGLLRPTFFLRLLLMLWHDMVSCLNPN